MGDKVGIFCTPTSYENYTEGRAEKCSVCGCEIWLSFSSIRAILNDFPNIKFDQAVELFCIDCGIKTDPKSITLLRPSEEQVKEINEVVKRGFKK